MCPTLPASEHKDDNLTTILYILIAVVVLLSVVVLYLYFGWGKARIQEDIDQRGNAEADDRGKLIEQIECLQKEVKELKAQAVASANANASGEKTKLPKRKTMDKVKKKKRRNSITVESPFRIPEMFNAMDADKSGGIDFDEFSRVCKSQNKADVRKLFEMLDRDGDGTITARELTRTMRTDEEARALAMQFGSLKTWLVVQAKKGSKKTTKNEVKAKSLVRHRSIARLKEAMERSAAVLGEKVTASATPKKRKGSTKRKKKKRR